MRDPLPAEVFLRVLRWIARIPSLVAILQLRTANDSEVQLTIRCHEGDVAYLVGRKGVTIEALSRVAQALWHPVGVTIAKGGVHGTNVKAERTATPMDRLSWKDEFEIRFVELTAAVFRSKCNLVWHEVEETEPHQCTMYVDCIPSDETLLMAPVVQAVAKAAANAHGLIVDINMRCATHLTG